MSNRRIEMYEYKQIIHKLQHSQTIREISRDGLASRDKISSIKKIAEEEGWLLPDSALPSEKELEAFFMHHLSHKPQSKCYPHAEMIKTFIEQGIGGTVIYQHLKDNYGFTGSYDSVQRFIKKIRQHDIDKLTVPLHFKPAEAAQVDFGKGPDLLDERTGAIEESWFFIMTLCWSRHQYVRLVTHQDIQTWLDCHQNAFYWFGGVVNKIIIDNPKCAITTACYYDPQVQRSYEAFAQEYGFIISACPPRDPKKKGRVESGVKFVKRNFLPLRNFKSLQDANSQLQAWILGTAGNRTHGSTFKKPLSQFIEIEKPLLKPLPTVPVEIAIWRKVLLHKNCHIRYLKNYYSAPYQLYDKELWIKVTSTTVSIYYQYEVVAVHVRLFKAGEYSTCNAHLPPKAQAFFTMDKDWCLEQSKVIGSSVHLAVQKLLSDGTRDLLRSAQGVIKLGSNYGNLRLESACRRAIYWDSVSYKSIREILKSGADMGDTDHTVNPATDASNDKLEQQPDGGVYTGAAVFQRNVIEGGVS